jgi:acetoin utilization deacetylase AcuC-like enzyme
VVFRRAAVAAARGRCDLLSMARPPLRESLPPSVRALGRRVPVQALVERARRGLRRLAARVTPPPALVVCHTGYAPPDGTIVDAERGAKILNHLLAEGWLLASQVHVPEGLALSALRRVHDDGYLESLDAPLAVARALGGAEPPPVRVAAGYLAAQRWATAGTVLATELALAERRAVVNLGGGFHHADRARGSGFCLFHDVATALEEARAGGFRGRVLVLDLDLHQGDGTRRIYRDDPDVLAASVHATAWDEDPAQNAIDLALGSGVGDATYLEAVRDVLERATSKGEPDLVFYVAGVDVAIDDTLGSWRVSAEAIAERDRLVLERFVGKPLVMVLAGGYGPDAWRHSARTLVWLFSGEDRPIPTTTDVELRHFRRVARSLGEAQLSGRSQDDDFGITEADLLGDLVRKGPGDHLLGFYTAYGLELAFERYGLFDHMRRRGYPRVRVELNPHSGSGEAVTVRTDDARRLVLLELIVREMREVAPYRLLSIEWLLLQDPAARPTAARPLLPGQEHPGLGALRLMMGHAHDGGGAPAVRRPHVRARALPHGGAGARRAAVPRPARRGAVRRAQGGARRPLAARVHAPRGGREARRRGHGRVRRLEPRAHGGAALVRAARAGGRAGVRRAGRGGGARAEAARGHRARRRPCRPPLSHREEGSATRRKARARALPFRRNPRETAKNRGERTAHGRC